MKIGINARAFSTSEPGGAVQAAMSLTRTLTDDQHVEVVLFGHNNIVRDFDSTPIVSQYYLTDSREFGVIWERSFLPYLAKNEGIDILFCPNGNAPIMPLDIPIITWIHDVGSQRGWMSPLHRFYRNITLPRTASVSDRIVTTSEFTKQEIQDELKVSSEKIDVIYNGIDEYYLGKGDGEPFDLPENYILFVTSSMELGTRKNLDTVIKAFEILEAEYDTDHELVLIGGENKDIYNETTISEDKIHMMGYVSKPNLKYAYKKADVFLFPSFHEGFGLPPIEAMACETPVIASNVASIPEILGDSSILIDPRNEDEIVEEIIKLQDSEYREKLLSEQAKIPSRYTWERTKQRFLSSIEKIVDTSNK